MVKRSTASLNNRGTVEAFIPPMFRLYLLSIHSWYGRSQGCSGSHLLAFPFGIPSKITLVVTPVGKLDLMRVPDLRCSPNNSANGKVQRAPNCSIITSLIDDLLPSPDRHQGEHEGSGNKLIASSLAGCIPLVQCDAMQCNAMHYNEA